MCEFYLYNNSATAFEILDNIDLNDINNAEIYDTFIEYYLINNNWELAELLKVILFHYS